MPDLRYPVGKFQRPEETTPEQRQQWIGEIAAAPANLRAAVSGLSGQQLDTPYRPEGWTVRQVVHHLPDSHLNSYVRFRLALTEENPTIKPYNEASWAGLPDAQSGPVDVSLALLDSLHGRWVLLLKAMTDQEFARTFRHPERGEARLDRDLALYAWHCRHHVAHITGLRQRMNW